MNCPCAKVLRGKTLDGAKRRPGSRRGERKPLTPFTQTTLQIWR
ncbi:hypothetical protein BACCAP_02785 [Pseudoflavonifractor capillosus ATCC 29799]|uniref:Uncharacterized protein n=1 Tax=Pseudoflavonifractor capillosus ATCC 29799 TaxID=411467 RepID=A6NX40_9FIRM|nr:hypothetical protein BACCAP_02785 [Pseudoflavonifractor capillosus ATCC 29799]